MIQKERKWVQLLQSSVCDVLEKTDAMHDFEKLGFKSLFPLREKSLVLYAAISLNSDKKLKSKIQEAYNSLIESSHLYDSCKKEESSLPIHNSCEVVKPLSRY